MIKKIISILIAIVLVSGCFSACDKDENTYFACAVGTMPKHFDPQIAESRGERIVAVNIFDGLFKLSENGEIQNCAVTDYTVSRDGLVYTFNLRKDMKYYISDSVKSFLKEKETSIEGTVTAEDFVFGITRGIEKGTNAPDYELLSVIKNAEKVHNGESDKSVIGIRATDRYTLEITLERKSDNFLYALTQPISFPCDEEFFNITGGRYGLEKKYIISNGAFYLSDISAEESVRFSKNAEYAGNFAAIPTSVRLYVNTVEKNIAEKVNDGTYAVGFFSSAESIGELSKKTQQKSIENITVSLIFNMSRDVMKNINIRTGLIEGVDLSSVTQSPANTLLPSYCDLGNQKVEKPGYNVESSRIQIKKGFDELKISKLTVNILCTAENENIAKGVISCWQKNIGVELNGTVSVVEKKDFDARLKSGDYDTAIYPFTANSNRTADFLSVFKSESKNVLQYSSEEYDRIYNELKEMPTVEKADYCQSYLLKNAVVLPVARGNTVFATAKGVSGIYFYGDSSNLYFYKGQVK